MKNSRVITHMLLILLIISGVSTVITNYVMSNEIKHMVNNEVREELKIVLETLDNVLVSMEQEDASVESLLNNMASYRAINFVGMVDSTYRVIYATDVDKVEDILNRGNVRLADESNDVVDWRQEDKSTMEMAMPSTWNEQRIILVVTANAEYVLSLRQELIGTFRVYYLIFISILFSVIGIYLVYFIGRPLKKFTLAANAIAMKNYDYAVDYEYRGEFKELKRAYDAMRISIKNYTQELADAKNQTEKAAEAKMFFLTNMSHEIRTPLNSILGFTELLLEEEKNHEKNKKLLIVHKSGSHLLSVINDLLDFSKIESDQMETEVILFNIREMIQDIEDSFVTQFFSRQIEFNKEIFNSVPSYCKSDVNKIRQILINLLSNALKFTERGSIDLFVDYKPPFLKFTVQDTGVGIPEEKLDSIFDAFVQSDNSIARKYGGTGLGLAICKQFSQLLQGDIKVSSTLGQGTIFLVKVKVEEADVSSIPGETLLENWIKEDLDLADLVIETVQELPERMDKLKEAFDTGDIEAFKSDIHGLKGLTGNYQMEELYQLISGINDEVKEDEPNDEAITLYLNQAVDMVVRVSEAAAEREKSVTEEERQKDSIKNTIKILIAEDLKENQMLYEAILTPITQELYFANNGRDAIDMMYREEFDCLLLDIQMPEMSGEDVLRYFEQEKERGALFIPYTIVVTAHATIEEKEHFLQMGADDYISKPINKEKLKQMIINQSLRK